MAIKITQLKEKKSDGTFDDIIPNLANNANHSTSADNATNAATASKLQTIVFQRDGTDTKRVTINKSGLYYCIGANRAGIRYANEALSIPDIDDYNMIEGKYFYFDTSTKKIIFSADDEDDYIVEVRLVVEY